jgi:hypothetical protein
MEIADQSHPAQRFRVNDDTDPEPAGCALGQRLPQRNFNRLDLEAGGASHLVQARVDGRAHCRDGNASDRCGSTYRKEHHRSIIAYQLIWRRPGSGVQAMAATRKGSAPMASAAHPWLVTISAEDKAQAVDARAICDE